ncbi:uncharacterized protein LOC129587904 [Paramacrobiotus metropolitanus]|uniref:uncharacterized protein LOC129587904 n=1 Tax=Paramacrobiotus metropolitanus TaxID=2943436 RepID=UPI002445D617|nr:uncharacterized protein LOC129587904 [Paramacrobiotus metropolitanus]
MFLLVLLTPAVVWSAGVFLFIITEVLHAQYISNLRHLRFFELMGAPGLAGTGGRTSFIARSGWLTVWPTLPFIAVVYRSLEAAGQISTDTVDRLSRIYVLGAVFLSLPALYHLLDAVRWRFAAASLNLAARQRPGIRVTVVGSYYFCIDNLNWPSLGEEKVNRAYALVWISKLLWATGSVGLRDGPRAALSALPASVVAVSLSSYVSVFGLCWIFAYAYSAVFTRWLHSLDVVLTPGQAQMQEMQKYDLSGHLLVFIFQSRILAALPVKGDWTPLLRLIGFLVLFRLPKLVEYTRNFTNVQSLDATGTWRYYLQAVFQGTIAPLGLGVALFTRSWRAPLHLRRLASLVWEQTLPIQFAVEFELWLHTEVVLLLGDLLLEAATALLSLPGYAAHLYSTASPHFWHRYLATLDTGLKIWTQTVRELLTIFVHFLIMSYMFERLWHTSKNGGPLDSGVVEAVTFLVYFSRYADATVRFSHVTQAGLDSDVVCSYRCVIRELAAPAEGRFREWEDVCAICQGKEEDRLQLCELPCAHFFHRGCMEEWLKVRMVCPMCMRRVWLAQGRVQMDNVEMALNAELP